MEKETVWDSQWELMKKNALKETSFDSFAKKAFPCISRWITEKDIKILEAGSGTGRYCIALAKKYKDSTIIGLDISRNALMLTKAGMQERGIDNIHLLQADVFHLPFKSEVFDVVFNDGVIEHFRNYTDIIGEMARVIRRSGKIIVAVPNWYCFPHTIYKKIIGERYVYGYEKSFKGIELVSAFKHHGLKELELSGFNPAHSISRLSRFFGPVGILIDKLLIYPLDKISNDKISKKFGIEITIKGIKK